MWKKNLFIEKIIISHNLKYYVRSLKRSKVKLSDIRVLKEENIVLIH